MVFLLEIDLCVFNNASKTDGHPVFILTPLFYWSAKSSYIFCWVDVTNNAAQDEMRDKKNMMVIKIVQDAMNKLSQLNKKQKNNFLRLQAILCRMWTTTQLYVHCIN